MPLEELVQGSLVKLLELSPAIGILGYIVYRQNLLLERFLGECWQHLLSDAAKVRDEDTHTARLDG